MKIILITLIILFFVSIINAQEPTTKMVNGVSVPLTLAEINRIKQEWVVVNVAKVEQAEIQAERDLIEAKKKEIRILNEDCVAFQRLESDGVVLKHHTKDPACP